MVFDSSIVGQRRKIICTVGNLHLTLIQRLMRQMRGHRCSDRPNFYQVVREGILSLTEVIKTLDYNRNIEKFKF